MFEERYGRAIDQIAVLIVCEDGGVQTFVKDKKGFHFLPMDVPQDKGKEGLRAALRLLPGEVAADLNNGGLSFGYTALYYTDLDIVNGLEGKASYIFGDDTDDFVRMDITAFKEYEDFMKFGAGVSVFGDMTGSFYKEDSAYGANAYVDLLDIFRFTYVYRDGDSVVGFDFGSSRHMLITCGWIMAVTNYFNKIMIQSIAHYGCHFILPLVVAVLFFKSNWKIAYFTMLAGLLIDVDHLLASPIFDSNR